MTAAVRTLAVAHGWREVVARRAQVAPPCDWCGVPSVLCAGPTRGACIDHAPSLAGGDDLGATRAASLVRDAGRGAQGCSSAVRVPHERRNPTREDAMKTTFHPRSCGPHDDAPGRCVMRVVDLFAGAGGTSTGMSQAGHHVVCAVNHWRLAVDAHALNHPEARHVCQDAATLDPRDLPAHEVETASPECITFSPAKGGRAQPHRDLSRATAWCVVNTAEVTRPTWLVVENVPAFRAWERFPSGAAPSRRWATTSRSTCSTPRTRRPAAPLTPLHHRPPRSCAMPPLRDATARLRARRARPRRRDVVTRTHAASLAEDAGAHRPRAGSPRCRRAGALLQPRGRGSRVAPSTSPAGRSRRRPAGRSCAVIGCVCSPWRSRSGSWDSPRATSSRAPRPIASRNSGTRCARLSRAPSGSSSHDADAAFEFPAGFPPRPRRLERVRRVEASTTLALRATTRTLARPRRRDAMIRRGAMVPRRARHEGAPNQAAADVPVAEPARVVADVPTWVLLHIEATARGFEERARLQALVHSS